MSISFHLGHGETHLDCFRASLMEESQRGTKWMDAECGRLRILSGPLLFPRACLSMAQPPEILY
jgi:hypothetical protein